MASKQRSPKRATAAQPRPPENLNPTLDACTAVQRTFAVGRYACTVSFPSLAATEGGTACMTFEWAPSLPRKFSSSEWKTYRNRRDKALREICVEVGLDPNLLLVVEPGADDLTAALEKQDSERLLGNWKDAAPALRNMPLERIYTRLIDRFNRITRSDNGIVVDTDGNRSKTSANCREFGLTVLAARSPTLMEFIQSQWLLLVDVGLEQQLPQLVEDRLVHFGDGPLTIDNYEHVLFGLLAAAFYSTCRFSLEGRA